MRIQHNIMAMNAYRNYNTNTSALSKNLEKLSSGYKINRAGDDAAGLAISEKMRAQITGLNAASKNVKDGISLVKTAEGAMQEIQDMLNRMDYLATQSANGTYQNEVDRENLQKEVVALKDEINRIADSANFNGIKLLDGSLDTNAELGGTAAVEAVESGLETAAVGDVLGTNTIKHTEAAGNNEPTKFKVDLADFQFSGKNGESMTITVGDQEIKITATQDLGVQNGSQIAAEIAKQFGANTATAGWKVEVNGTALTGNQEYIQFDGQDFTVTAEDNKLVFTQKDAPTSTAENVDGKMDVTISGSGTAAVKAGWTTGAYTAGTTDAVGTTGMQDDASVAVTVSVPDSTGAGGADETLTFTTANLENAATIDDVVTALKATTANNANGDTVKLEDMYDITATADGKINFALKDGKDGTITGVTYTADSGTAAGTDVKATLGTGAAVTGAAAGAAGSSGDYNVQTIEVENGVYKDRDRLASTVVKLKDEQIVNGAQLKIGTQTITLSDADADKGTVSSDKIYIGDLKKADGTIDMDVFTERLSQATADNTIWTVSAKAGKDGITLMEATNADGTSAGNAAAKALLKDKDLTSEEGIKATLGYVSAAKDAVAGTAGKALNLQIGDTSDEFNQMKIEIGDMHVEAMSYTDDEGNTSSIRDIDILTSENAQAAVDVIKNAINYVSGVRGDLGAYQNRLEHTANNLSVMAENIQDAESTIRDTDVAEEMMSYVKNNILVQSAQAMLAQANQVPQGVLQLLG